MMKIKLIAFFCLIFPPSKIKNYILKQFGWEIANNVYIGFSYISTNKVSLYNNTRIGHLNFINLPCLQMRANAYIQNLNRITGPIYVFLDTSAALGNLNTIKRAKHPISWGRSIFKVGIGSKVTSKHIIDCTRPIYMGDYSIIAGQGRQLWTHGYIHNTTGDDRFRIDGSIKIGNNVYIGSATVINPGICISDAITVGSHSTVAKSLKEPGLYVNQSLRYIPQNYYESYRKYPKVNSDELIEKIVHKKC
jgi:acetyltransferase-like isoleucine patch superfamily enzyme